VASYGDLLVTSLVVLAGVCIAAFVIVRVFGRFLATGRVRGAHLLDVIARVPLEPRRSLYVVEVAGKTLLVGTSEMGLSVLSELDGAEVRSRVVERPSFGELVKQAWSRRKGLGKAVAREPTPSPPPSTSAKSSAAASDAAASPDAASDEGSSPDKRGGES
jgi:flagellar biogenesis protein FliO